MINNRTKYMIMFAGIILFACKLPGMIPLTPRPDMEKDTEVLIEMLNGDGWVPMQALAPERYEEEAFAKPGTVIFSPLVTNESPVYFSYGWCTVDEETLQQNFEHIEVNLYFEGEKLGSDVVHNLSFERSDGLVCVDFGAMLSNWSPGEYELKTVAIFDEKINDGLDDYEAGDYITIYNVKVEE